MTEINEARKQINKLYDPQLTSFNLPAFDIFSKAIEDNENTIWTKKDAMEVVEQRLTVLAPP